LTTLGDNSRSIIDNSRSKIDNYKSIIDSSRVMLLIMASSTIVIYGDHIFTVQATG
jgi:hypothetical protein